MEKLIPPAQCKITITQQPKGCRMIIEDQNMSDCFATYGYKSRLGREDSLLSSRCCIRQPVDSKIHHSFLKRSKIDISHNLKFLSKRNVVTRIWLPGPDSRIRRKRHLVTTASRFSRKQRKPTISSKQNCDTFRFVSFETKPLRCPRSRLKAGSPRSATGRTTRAGPLSNRALRVAWKAGRLRAAKVFRALC